MATQIDRSTPPFVFAKSRFTTQKTILPDLPGKIDFDPKIYIHCRYLFVVNKTSTNENIIFKKEISTYLISTESIKEIVDGIIDGKPVGSLTENAKDPNIFRTNGISTPFDIGINQQCYIIIELDRRHNWHFSKKFKAIAQKITNNNGHEDGDVFHVSSITRSHFPDPLVSENCTIAYFGVKSRGSPHEAREYDVRVRFNQDNYAVELNIDPDIPNTGAAPFPPPP